FDTNRLDRVGVRALLGHPGLRGRVWFDLRNNAGWILERAIWQARTAGTPGVLELDPARGLVPEVLRYLRQQQGFVVLHELTFSRQEITLPERHRLLHAP